MHPRRYQAERRELVRARRQTFHDPPSRRNRVWQTDFSELETRAGGIWQMGAVLDYVTKFCLTCPVTATKTWREAVACLEAARERAGELLGYPLIADLVDRDTGDLEPVVVVPITGRATRRARSRATSAPGRSSSTSAPGHRSPRATA